MIGESGLPAERSVVRGLSITEVVVFIVWVVVIERSGVMGVVAVVEEFSSLIIHFFGGGLVGGANLEGII